MISNIEKLHTFKFDDRYKVLSWDVFDTLLIRKTDPPEEVKKIVAKNIVKSGILDIPPDEYLALRESVEQMVRSQNQTDIYDPECTLEEINKLLLERLNDDPDKEKALLELELTVEKSLISAMPGVKEILNKLKDRYRLIAVSDTYLPLWMLNELLEASGLIEYFEKVYCSCEYRLSKGSGKLFEKVFTEEKLERRELLHIGDNIFSDYYVPKNLGIDAIHLYDEWNLERKATIRVLNDRGNISDFWKGYSFISRLNSINREGKQRHCSLYSWGKNVVGPLLTLYVHLLIRELQKEEFDKIFFIARDGFLLKKIYNIFSKSLYDGTLPEITYLCLSRHSCFLSSIHELSERELAISGPGYSRVGDSLRRLGFEDTDEISGYLTKYGLSVGEFIHEKGSNTEKTIDRLENLFNDEKFEEIVTDKSAEARALLEKYLRQEGLLGAGGRVAMVDIGWSGTIQDSIEHAFSEAIDLPDICGYYLALNPPISENERIKKGLIYDYRNSFPEEMSVTFFKEALEFSCRAFHGATMGYRVAENGRVLPIFTNNPSEKQLNPSVHEMQRGILDFANDYVNLYKILEVNPDLLKPAVTKIYESFLSDPNEAYVKAIEEMANSDDFSVDTVRKIVWDLSFKDLMNPKKFRRDLKEIPWKEASIQKIGVPFLITLYNFTKRMICIEQSERVFKK